MPNQTLLKAHRVIGLPVLLILLSALSVSAQNQWQTELQRQLPLLGHRNWIVIADSAYPWQSAPGIETLYADADELEVLQTVLDQLARSKHVKPIIYTDAELNYVPERRAAGIANFRQKLKQVLAQRTVETLPHEQTIAKLDQAGKTFKVLLIKTRLTLPYTSVFLQLDCAYWDAASERELREAMKASGGK